jgi:pyridoxal phosphate enzyme (YggS family)
MSLAENLQQVESRIAEACIRAGRQRSEVKLVAVSKTHPVAAIQELYDLGIRDFGESRAQELLQKQEQLSQDIRWHFIGPLQSNKAKQLVPVTHLFHAVGSMSALNELARIAEKHENPTQVLLQINISNEAQKHGFEENEAGGVLEMANGLPNLSILGLMGMASFEEDPENTREQFCRLKLLHKKLTHSYPQLDRRTDRFVELSMGMTNDFEVAIEEGSTLVRIGSAIFGAR